MSVENESSQYFPFKGARHRTRERIPAVQAYQTGSKSEGYSDFCSKSGIKISSYSLLRCFPLLNLVSIKSVILSSAGEWGGGGTEKYGFKNSSEDNIPCQLVREYK